MSSQTIVTGFHQLLKGDVFPGRGNQSGVHLFETAVKDVAGTLSQLAMEARPVVNLHLIKLAEVGRVGLSASLGTKGTSMLCSVR